MLFGDSSCANTSSVNQPPATPPSRKPLQTAQTPMTDFKINISLDESSSSLENSSFRDRNLSSNQKRRSFSQTSKVSSAISLIDDSEDESDQTLASDNEDSDKENNDDVNELQEVSYSFY